MQQKLIKKNLSKLKIKPNLENYSKTYNSFSWEDAKKEITFFSDGKMNAASIAVDVHAKSKKKDKIALIYNNSEGDVKEFTFGELSLQTNKFANVLKKYEANKGDRIFIFLPTIPERYIAFLSILKMGGVVGTMFSAFQEIALLDRLADSEAKIVITSSELYPRVEKIWKDLPSLEKVVIIDNESLKEEKNIISYPEEMKKASSEFEVEHLSQDDYSYMLYTSGTTGKPKGVVHAHGDIVQAMMTTKYVLDIHDEDVYWCTADSGWVTGVVYGILGIWGLGGTSVIYGGRFTPESWYKVLQDNKVSVWYTAPTAIRMLMGSKVKPKDFNFSNLRHLASVGEPLNPEGIWWSMENFGLPFHDTWWQTETGSMAIVNYPSMDIKPGSMGKPFPGVKAAIVDDKGMELAENEEGDLALDPSTIPSLMKTIWKNDKKYKSYFANNWYLSGDRAYKDKDGYYWFVGRFDDVINTSGERIGPFEVESALVEHPDVVEAGVIGKPDELRGQIIKAFVVLRTEVKESEDLKAEIKTFVKKNLAGHAYPREIEFTDRLPKTRSGKIMRRVLKARDQNLPEGDTSTLEEY